MANIKYKPKEEKEEMPPFWIRRTREYKNMVESEENYIGGVSRKNLWMP
jgi:hypothetical protein